MSHSGVMRTQSFAKCSNSACKSRGMPLDQNIYQEKTRGSVSDDFITPALNFPYRPC